MAIQLTECISYELSSIHIGRLVKQWEVYNISVFSNQMVFGHYSTNSGLKCPVIGILFLNGVQNAHYLMIRKLWAFVVPD